MTGPIIRPAYSSWPAYELIRRPDWDESWVHTRDAVIQRVFSHDVWHTAEVNETLGRAGLPMVDPWG